MGAKCCYSSRNYNLQTIDSIDTLLIVISEHIKRILFILEEYTKNSQDSKDLNLKDFYYYVKLQTTLIHFKMIIEDYRKVNSSKAIDLDNMTEGESKALALLKRGIYIKLDKSDPIFLTHKLNLENSVSYLEDILTTEEPRDMEALSALELVMTDRIFQDLKKK